MSAYSLYEQLSFKALSFSRLCISSLISVQDSKDINNIFFHPAFLTHHYALLITCWFKFLVGYNNFLGISLACLYRTTVQTSFVYKHLCYQYHELYIVYILRQWCVIFIIDGKLKNRGCFLRMQAMRPKVFPFFSDKFCFNHE